MLDLFSAENKKWSRFQTFRSMNKNSFLTQTKLFMQRYVNILMFLYILKLAVLEYNRVQKPSVLVFGGFDVESGQYTCSRLADDTKHQHLVILLHLFASTCYTQQQTYICVLVLFYEHHILHRLDILRRCPFCIFYTVKLYSLFLSNCELCNNLNFLWVLIDTACGYQLSWMHIPFCLFYLYF